MNQQIQQHVSNCMTCKEFKVLKHILKQPMGQQLETFRPFKRLYMDYLGPYPRSKNGYRFILIILGHFSKYIRLVLLRFATAEATENAISIKILSIFSVPEYIVTNNAKHGNPWYLNHF